jgi:hypothetical protein
MRRSGLDLSRFDLCGCDNFFHRCVRSDGCYVRMLRRLHTSLNAHRNHRRRHWFRSRRLFRGCHGRRECWNDRSCSGRRSRDRSGYRRRGLRYLNMDRWQVLRFGGNARLGRNSGYLPPKLQHFAVKCVILLRGSLSNLFDLKAKLPLPPHRRNGEDRSG